MYIYYFLKAFCLPGSPQAGIHFQNLFLKKCTLYYMVLYCIILYYIVLWYYGVMVLWDQGIMVLWYILFFISFLSAGVAASGNSFSEPVSEKMNMVPMETSSF